MPGGEWQELPGTIGGERQQTGITNSDDGKKAASSPDSLSGSDPKQPDDIVD